MSNVNIVFIGIVLSIIVLGFALMGLYIGTRMVTRAIMRSIEEWKERKKNGY